MTGKRRNEIWWTSLVLFSLLLSFVSSLNASALYERVEDSASNQFSDYENAAKRALPPITNAPFDWFNGLSARNQRLVTIILCVLMMLMGVFFIMFGYRIFRPSLALVGFVVIFIVLWVVLTVHAPKLKWWAVLLISLACGLVAAALCFFIYHIGIALLGCALGFTMATLLLSTPFGTKAVTNYWAHFAIILVFSLVFSILAVIFQRLIIIIGTSALGAYLFCTSIDVAWMHTGILTDIIVQFFSKDPHFSSRIAQFNTWQAYTLMGGDLALILFGVIIQFGITARNYDHRSALKGRKRNDDEREGLLVNAFYQD